VRPSRLANALVRAAALSAALLPAVSSAAPPPQPPLAVIPLPREIATGERVYEWGAEPRLGADSADERAAAATLADHLRSLGLRPAVVARSAAGSDVTFVTLVRADGVLGSEGYALRVGASGVTIEANAAAGLANAVRTLVQLTARRAGPVLQTQTVSIRDWPRYRWRGIHLDVSRHFFPVATVERYIDVAARYKLNVFHWHLTDDEGWRIEIKSHPLLTRAGSCGAQRECGYYTQAEIAEVVRYAAQRHVTIVPEIEVPGHAGAALAAYPELSCGAVAVPKVYCPTERTFRFLEDVLAEIVALFPGPYVHIGGDEVSSREWRSSAAVAELMRRERLSSYAAVQGYVTMRLARFLERNGRRAVAWDEVLAAPVPASVVVMAWRGGMTDVARRSGRDVVASPDGPLYFDAYQGDSAQEPPTMRFVATLDQVYRYDAGDVMGVQANLWTEQVATADHLFYMLLPRELALAEVAWSTPSARSWESFGARLPPELTWLERHGYRFRIPDVAFDLDDAGAVFAEVPGRIDAALALVPSRAVRVALSAPAPGTIRYTTDGSAPTIRSPLYRAPFTVDLDAGGAVVKAAAFLDDGSRGPLTACRIRRGVASHAAGTFPSWSALLAARSPNVYRPPRGIP
jgi:hexosaminidase